MSSSPLRPATSPASLRSENDSHACVFFSSRSPVVSAEETALMSTLSGGPENSSSSMRKVPQGRDRSTPSCSQSRATSVAVTSIPSAGRQSPCHFPSRSCRERRISSALPEALSANLKSSRAGSMALEASCPLMETCRLTRRTGCILFSAVIASMEATPSVQVAGCSREPSARRRRRR